MAKAVVSTEPDRNGSTAAGWIGGVRAVAEMIKALTPPVLFLIVGAAFFEPISRIVHMLPDKFRDADKVSAVGLTLEIERKASEAGNPKLAELVGGLSRQAITTLLRTTGRRGIVSYSTYPDGQKFYYLPDKSQIEAMEELQRKGLLECTPKISEWAPVTLPLFEKASDRDAYVLKDKGDTGKHDAICGLSDAGKSATELVIDAVAQQITSSRSAVKDSRESMENKK